MKTNDGTQAANKAGILTFGNRYLGLRIGNKTEIPAQEINGHYTFRARVPNGSCECPDLNE